MQPLENQQSTQQLPATGNPQNAGQNTVTTQQSNLQQTAGLDAITKTTDKGVPIKIDMSDLAGEIQKQASPAVPDNSGVNTFLTFSIIILLIAVILWYIGSRAQKQNK